MIKNKKHFFSSLAFQVTEEIWSPIQETMTDHALSYQKQNFPVVAFHGIPGSGKDTLAANLSLYHDFKRVSFAGPLKKSMSTLFNFSPSDFECREKKERPILHYNNLTPRITAQRGGDGLKMAFGENFLVDIARAKIKETLFHFPVIVTDLRFLNEAEMIREFDHNVIIKLDPGDRIKSLGSGANHKSNKPLPDSYIDYIVRTDCSPKESEKAIKEILGLGERYTY